MTRTNMKQTLRSELTLYQTSITWMLNKPNNTGALIIMTIETQIKTTKMIHIIKADANLK